jgi:hypothetical protein
MSIKASNNVFPHDPDDNWRSKTDKGGCELTAQQILDRIDEIEAPDDILVRGDIIKAGSLMSIAALAYTCRINQEILTNPDEFETTIEVATEGYKRIDILVFTKFATIQKIQGLESVDAAEEPPTPPDTIKISFVSVFGSIIGDPEVPDMNGYITKVSKGFFRMFYTGHIDSVPVDDKSYLKFEPGMLSLKSLQIADTNFLYHGRDFIIKNGTTADVTLFHLQGTGNFRFSLPNALDLILKPEESVHFVMRAINATGNGGLLDYVGLGIFKEELSNKKTTIVGNEASDTFYGSVKAWITYLKDNWLTSLATKVTITDTTMFPVEDEADSNKAKVVSWLNIKNTINTYFDTLFQAKDNQVEISANSNVLNAWHGQTVLFTESCTITVPASLNSSLMFPFRTLPGVTVTWAITSPFNWETTPSTTTEKKVGHFMRRGSTNTIMLDV